MQLTCSIISDLDQLAAQKQAWTELLARSDADQPVLSPTWLLAWWRTFGSLGGRRLAVGAFHDAGGRLVGLAPLVARRHWYKRAIPFRRLEMLGSGEPREDEICSEYLNVIAERGAEDAVARALVDALIEGKFGGWDELILPLLDGSVAMPAKLVDELRRAGVETDLAQVSTARYVELPRSWEAYLESLSSSNRYMVNRSLRDFDQWSGGRAVLRAVTTPDDLPAGRAALIALHGERWGDGGVFASERFTAFHDAVMPELLASGALELIWMEVDGEPVSALYSIAWKGKVHFYQSGRSVTLPKNLRPGIVMHAHGIRRAIAAGHREYDFLGGNTQYKRQLAEGARPILSLRAVRPGVLEQTRVLAFNGVAAARRIEQRLARRRAPEPAADASQSKGPAAVLCGDLGMLRCFQGTPVSTLVVSSNPADLTFFSRHCAARRVMANPRRDPVQAARDLERIGRVFPEKPALYYGDDAMLLLISRSREELAKHYRFLMPDAERIETLVDKTRFAELAARLDLPAPRTVTSSDRAEARHLVAHLEGPWIVKPHTHIGWNAARQGQRVKPFKALCAENPEALARALDQVKAFSADFVVQEMIPGGEDQIYSFHAYVDAKRRPLGHFVGKKIRTYPMSAGVSTYVELVREPELVRLGLEVLEKLGHVGIVKLDFKRDPRTGRFYLLEVNPRFNLWNYLGAACGINLPLIAWRDLAGMKPEPVQTEYKTDVRWLSFGNDARSFVRDYAPAGEIGLGEWIQSLRGPKVFEIFAWDDATPLVLNMARALRGHAKRLLPQRAGEGAR